MKLIQKQFLKGRREFDISDDIVTVRIKSLLKEEKLTVDLSTLDPEPVKQDGELVFYSRYKGHPAMSLLADNPSVDAVNAFVATLKQYISGNVTEPANAIQAEAPGWNVYDEPPGFDESDKVSFPPVKADRVGDDITMLKTYLNEADIQPMLDALEALKAEPQSEAAFQNMLAAYNELGFNQGAVLTYAPYLKVLLSQSNPFALN